MQSIPAFTKTLCYVIGCLGLLYLYAQYLEARTIYYPTRVLEATPGDIGLEYEDIFFSTEDNVKLHGWFIPKNGAKTTLVFAHGNGGNISHRLEKILFFNKLGLNIFIFDYRGYGKSRGCPSEAGLYRDGRAALSYLKSAPARDDKGKQAIIVYGESLGGAVAIDLAAKEKIDGLILEGTFTNVRDMARIIYPVLPAFLIKSKFDSLAKIREVEKPKLCLHSRDDDIVPFLLGRKLFDAASQPKEFLELSGGHNDAFFVSQTKIAAALKVFMQKIIR
ncbi:MAG: alpha/beta hydrolase [Candidatus Omnitrophica bacterium]|nr:alpha/beta hydrolase [Candidatus Omnitrophota bacterium]MBU1924343.1 alpha/beta hydrolase [Candidatus Omnitrophota bacterium]